MNNEFLAYIEDGDKRFLIPAKSFLEDVSQERFEKFEYIQLRFRQQIESLIKRRWAERKSLGFPKDKRPISKKFK